MDLNIVRVEGTPEGRTTVIATDKADALGTHHNYAIVTDIHRIPADPVSAMHGDPEAMASLMETVGETMQDPSAWTATPFGAIGKAVLKGLKEKHYTTHYRELVEIVFQEGPYGENGVNGIQIEDLLVIAIHRLQLAQQAVPCSENTMALECLRGALDALKARSEDRQNRGVQGTYEQ